MKYGYMDEPWKQYAKKATINVYNRETIGRESI